MIDPLSSIGALSRAGSSVASSASAATPTRSFAEALGQTAESGLVSLNGAEVTAAKGLTGEASTREVAEAVMQAERSLQSAIAIRDKVVSAWLDISRMAI